MNRLSALVLISLLALQGCAKEDSNLGEKAEMPKGPIGGKFLIDSFRKGNHANFAGVYLHDAQGVMEVGVRIGRPKWSSDGKRFALTSGNENKIFTYDSDLSRTGGYELPAYPINQAWVDGDAKILAIIDKYLPQGADSKTGDFEHRLIEIDFKTSEIRTLHTYELNHRAGELIISPDERYVATSPVPSYQNKTGWIEIYDRLTNTAKKHPFSGSVLGWYPDGKHLMIDTNYYADGKRINDRLGAVVKYDLTTDTYEIVYEPDVFTLRAKAYAGCKYVGYIAGTKTGGTACFIRNVATGQVHQITEPVMNPDLNQMSQDMDFDWYPPKEVGD